MKPNVLIKILWIIISVMLVIRISKSQSQNHRYCGKLMIHNKHSRRYLRIDNNSVLADSEDKYELYSINIVNSIKFYLYDNKTDRFICLNKKKQKLVPKRMPDLYCQFEDRILTEDVNSAFIKYVQPDNNFVMEFDRKGVQVASKHKTRHRHSRRNINMSAFLSKKTPVQCYTFCNKMRNRKRLKSMEQIRTVCRLDSKSKYV